MSWIKVSDKKTSAIGYTNGAEIVISSALSTDEREVVLWHEKSHILLQHTLRLPEAQKVDRFMWNVACDLEIARHMYTADHEWVIKKPRSRLTGGIVHADTEKYPGCEFAEEFYNALIEQADNKGLSPIDSLGDAEKETLKGEVAKALRELSEEAAQKASATAIQQHKESLARFRLRLSLAGEMDAVLAYGKAVRRRTYARPSRRVTGEFLAKGTKSILKVPKVIVYVDCSGSFTPEKTQTARARLSQILLRYRSSVTKDVKYFSDKVFSEVDSPYAGGGTNYMDVLADINDCRPEVAVILTDADRNADLPQLAGGTKVIVIPIGCSATWLASAIPNAVECLD